MLSTSYILFDLFIFVASAILALYSYWVWSYKHWRRAGVFYIKPEMPFGSYGNPRTRTESRGQLVKRFYDTAKDLGHQHVGAYLLNKPIYIPIDLDLIRSIVQVDFQNFSDKGLYVNEKDDPLSQHLFALGGNKWKHLRTKLTPTFTSGKMKIMFSTMAECSSGLKRLAAEACDNKPFQIKEAAACFTTDVIGSCAFGLDCKSFEDSNSPFRKYGIKIFDNLKLNLKQSVVYLFPELSKQLGLRMTPQDIENFFMNIVKDTIEFRETNNQSRKDFIQLLMELKENSDKNENLTIEQLVAQCFVFFVAGYETSSSTIMFTMFELARNKDIQDRVRREIRKVLEAHDEKLCYEAIQEMKYLGQIINETLRMYPSLPVLHRKCTKTYRVPKTDVVLQEGQLVHIPVYALHYDPEHFPEPELYNPDRFSEENRANIKPFSYLPFGGGPRTCIGLRFGLMQSKVGLVNLLKDYEFSLNSKTVTPLKMCPKRLFTSVVDDIWLDVKKAPL